MFEIIKHLASLHICFSAVHLLCRSVCLPARLFVYLSVCLSPYVCHSVRLSLHPSANLSVLPSALVPFYSLTLLTELFIHSLTGS